MKTITRKELIAGVIIIIIFVCGYYLSGEPVDNIQPKIRVERSYTVEAVTDEGGNVEVNVK